MRVETALFLGAMGVLLIAIVLAILRFLRQRKKIAALLRRCAVAGIRYVGTRRKCAVPASRLRAFGELVMLRSRGKRCLHPKCRRGPLYNIFVTLKAPEREDSFKASHIAYFCGVCGHARTITSWGHIPDDARCFIRVFQLGRGSVLSILQLMPQEKEGNAQPDMGIPIVSGKLPRRRRMAEEERTVNLRGRDTGSGPTLDPNSSETIDLKPDKTRTSESTSATPALPSLADDTWREKPESPV